MESGPGAARWNNFIQMAWYNGWKKHHGIKFISVELPVGFCMFLYGPRSFKDSELDLLIDSDINNELEQAQIRYGVPQNMLKCMYGDSIFPQMSCLLSKHVSLCIPLQ